MNEITVIGGGYSVRAADFVGLPGKIICINDAFLHPDQRGAFADADMVISMDRLWTENRWPQLCLRARTTYIRKSAIQNIKERPEWLHLFECDNESTELTNRLDVLNGTNSGFCALNLAYALKPERINIIGLDLQRGPAGEPYWYPPYPWAKETGATSVGKFAEWKRQFAFILSQIDKAGIEVRTGEKVFA